MSTEDIQKIKEDGMNLEFVKPELQTYELCMEAVKQIGWTLEYVKPELQTTELCMIAVKQDGYALKYVKPELQTTELCMIAVEFDFLDKDYDVDDMPFKFVKPELQTYEMCMKAVKQTGWALKYVKPEFQTPEICMEALKGEAELIDPKSYHDKDIIIEVFECIKPENQTYELCLEALKYTEDEELLEHIRPELRRELGYFDISDPVDNEMFEQKIRENLTELFEIPNFRKNIFEIFFEVLSSGYEGISSDVYFDTMDEIQEELRKIMRKKNKT